MVSRNCLLINEDEPALHELADLLNQQGQVSKTFTANGVIAARKILIEQKIDLLFIRVKAWDEYRKIIPSPNASGNGVTRPQLHAPPIVIFLSGPKERSTLRLDKEVDFHLSAPYRASVINRLFARLGDPSFIPRALDFFFLKADRQYYAIAFSALRAVSSKGRMLTVQTDKAAYQIAGTLSGLQDRLPPLFCRVGPSLLVAGPDIMGGYWPSGAGRLFA
jgi:DNA-binding LytR/AlgR family response regulator